jgi:hypothetical protein
MIVCLSVSLWNNNYEPTLFALILLLSVKIQLVRWYVSKFYGSDVKAISGLSASMRETHKVKGMDDSRSFITAMKSFPMNIEVVQDFTYNATKPPVLKIRKP